MEKQNGKCKHNAAVAESGCRGSCHSPRALSAFIANIVSIESLGVQPAKARATVTTAIWPCLTVIKRTARLTHYPALCDALL